MIRQENKKIKYLIEYPDNITHIIEILNKEDEEAISTSEQIKHEIKFEVPSDPDITFQLIYAQILSLATPDPTRVHFDIARSIIKKINPGLLEKTIVIDTLARKLVNTCNKLKLKITQKIPNQIIEQINNAKKQAHEEKFQEGSGRSPLPFKIIKLDLTHDANKIFTKNGMHICNKIWIETLQQTGKKGIEQAKKYNKKLKQEVNPLGFWFNIKAPTIEEPFHASDALQILAGCIFDDQVKRTVMFAEKNVPALTTNTTDTLKMIFSPENEINKTKEQIQVQHQDAIVCSINIPTISPKMSQIVLKGAGKLNTVAGHRVLRHFPQEAFRQRINGSDDCRVLRYDRGATEISEKLGMTGGKATASITQIVHAMAYLEFKTPYFSGNLIQITKYKSPITNRQEALEILVGTPLLPYQTFYESHSLLIPLLSDPPLVNPNQSHAGQYLLQMQLMEECSSQSTLIAQNDVIQITQEQWEDLAQSSGLSIEILKKVQDRWTQDGTDGEKLLEKVDHNFYKLGPKYNKEWEFLKEQGSIRIKNSNRGKCRAVKRIN